MRHPSNLSYIQIDIIKHTAQFVAKNGQKFLIGLTEREKQNPTFDFLKPTNALFTFFTGLVESYAKCFMIKRVKISIKPGRNIENPAINPRSINNHYQSR